MFERLRGYCINDTLQRREYILDTLRSLNIEPICQKFSYDNIEIMNIFAKIGKEHPISAFSAHYDKVPEGDGALDNGAAVIEVLTTLETMLKTGYNKPFGFMFFDGEEQGSVGSKRYIQDQILHVPKIYNIDVAGRGNAVAIGDASMISEWFEYRPNSQELNKITEQTCEQIGIPYFHVRTGPSDNYVLNNANIDPVTRTKIQSTIIMTIPNNLGEYWQQRGKITQGIYKRLFINGVEDKIERVQPETLQMMTKLLLQIAENTN